MNIVDSSGWIEYFSDGENAAFFADAIEDRGALLTPVICIYEVFKKVLQHDGQAMAEYRAADLMKGEVINLTAELAMSAAMLGAELKLPMADAFLYAMAREYQATLWTQDEHFKGLPGVQFIEKRG